MLPPDLRARRGRRGSTVDDDEQGGVGRGQDGTDRGRPDQDLPGRGGADRGRPEQDRPDQGRPEGRPEQGRPDTSPSGATTGGPRSPWPAPSAGGTPPAPPYVPPRYVPTATAAPTAAPAPTPMSTPTPIPTPAQAVPGAGWGRGEPVSAGWGAPPAVARPRWVVPLVVAAVVALLVGVVGLGVGGFALFLGGGSSWTSGPEVDDGWWFADAEHGEYTGTLPYVGARSVAGLDEGTCFTSDDVDDEGVVDPAPVASCDEAHQAEVYVVSSLPDGEWPGEAAVADQALRVCEGEFEDFVGVDYWSSVADYGVFGPTEESWRGGDHELRCFAYAWTDRRTGSLGGSAE